VAGTVAGQEPRAELHRQARDRHVRLDRHRHARERARIVPRHGARGLERALGVDLHERIEVGIHPLDAADAGLDGLDGAQLAAADSRGDLGCGCIGERVHGCQETNTTPTGAGRTIRHVVCVS
jgi:hypothetical protein